MKSNIDDKCGELFKNIKFSKDHRFVTFKVDQERVVSMRRPRSPKRWAIGKATGRTSWRHSLPRNPGCVSSTLSTPATTA